MGVGQTERWGGGGGRRACVGGWGGGGVGGTDEWGQRRRQTSSTSLRHPSFLEEVPESDDRSVRRRQRSWVCVCRGWGGGGVFSVRNGDREGGRGEKDPGTHTHTHTHTQKEQGEPLTLAGSC